MSLYKESSFRSLSPAHLLTFLYSHLWRKHMRFWPYHCGDLWWDFLIGTTATVCLHPSSSQPQCSQACLSSTTFLDLCHIKGQRNHSTNFFRKREKTAWGCSHTQLDETLRVTAVSELRSVLEGALHWKRTQGLVLSFRISTQSFFGVYPLLLIYSNRVRRKCKISKGICKYYFFLVGHCYRNYCYKI